MQLHCQTFAQSCTLICRSHKAAPLGAVNGGNGTYAKFFNSTDIKLAIKPGESCATARSRILKLLLSSGELFFDDFPFVARIKPWCRLRQNSIDAQLTLHALGSLRFSRIGQLLVLFLSKGIRVAPNAKVPLPCSLTPTKSRCSLCELANRLRRMQRPRSDWHWAT